MMRRINGYVVAQWFCAALGGSAVAVKPLEWNYPGWTVVATFVVSTLAVAAAGWALDRFFGFGKAERRGYVHHDLTPPGPWDHLVPNPSAEGKERSDP